MMSMSSLFRLSLRCNTHKPSLFRSQRSLATAVSSGRSSFNNLPQTQVSTLNNGLRVATEKLDTETATIGVWIDAGSRFENAKTNGAAHFLEHMAFKGTEKRTQHALELEIENMGGHLNAYTSREQTVYYAKVFKKDVPKAVDILSDILTKSKLATQNIEREREVILREAEEVSKQMDEVVFDHLHATAYQGTSLGRTILGTEENIQSLNRSDLTNYISQNYLAPRMVVAAAGGIQHDDICKLSEAAFGSLPTASSPSNSTSSATTTTTKGFEPARFTGSEIRLRDDHMPVSHIALAVEGAGWQSKDHFPLLLIQSIVGSWDRALGAGQNVSSRLAQEVQLGKTANSFMSFNTSYTDTGLFGIYLTTESSHNQDDLMYIVYREWIRIAMNCTEMDLARAKNQLKTSLLLQLDGTTPVAEDIGRQLLTYGRRINPQELEAMIDRVDVKTIRQVGQKYLYDRDFALAAIGPIESLPDYNRIRSMTHMSRY